MTLASRRTLLRLLSCMPLLAAQSIQARPSGRRAHYIYVLRVAPRFHGPGQWTERESAIVARHFEHLARAAESRQLILAGRTTEAPADTFGVVIFEAEDDDMARRFMQADPAVAAGLMLATLHPYAVALQRRPWAE